ncbi:MAG: helix-turn-helix transcriptional regulator [Chloroflexota bacterium]
MSDQIVFFTDLPAIPHATTLGPINSYIVQTGQKMCCLSSKFHRHAWYELVWITGGDSSYFVDFQEYKVPDGSLVFISPGQVHEWFNLAQNARLIVIGFVPELFTADMLDIQNTLIDLPFFTENAAPIYTVSAAERPLFEQFFTTTLRRVSEQPDQRETLLRVYLSLILVEAQNALQQQAAPKLGNIPAPLRLTRRFRLAVERSYLERPLVQDYAAQLGVTTNHLVETVRQITGTTPKRLIQDRLLLEAKRLLAHTALSADQVSKELSFPNASQFGRWFRTNVGLAPGQFRQQVFS